jgi:pimeloyl-ACP methyl ester carboxylesterase
MRIEVNGVRIFFDVEGAKLVPDGPAMREKPTLILLHGGPGLDHSGFKPAFSQFADICQVVYIDHRGNGRSDRGPHEAWNLPQWGDDIFEFCRALEIEKPIVLGNSFGGNVAIAYATRHAEHPGKLIFSSTRARSRKLAHTERSIELFEKFGGPEVGELARKHLLDGYAIEHLEDWSTKAMPLYNRRATPNPDAAARAVRTAEVLIHFGGPGGEAMTFDMLSDLARISCPTLVLGGEDDPMTPIEDQEDIAAAIPPHLVRFERFANAGHGAYRDDPGAVFPIIREFILS